MKASIVEQMGGLAERKRMFVIAAAAVSTLALGVVSAPTAGATDWHDYQQGDHYSYQHQDDKNWEASHDSGYVATNDWNASGRYAQHEQDKQWNDDCKDDAQAVSYHEDKQWNEDKSHEYSAQHDENWNNDWSHESEKQYDYSADKDYSYDHNKWNEDNHADYASHHEDKQWSGHDEWKQGDVAHHDKNYGHEADYASAHDDKMNDYHADKTIAEIAGEKEQLSTLNAAVAAADLGEALSGETELTVFAPTNKAFEKLPEGTVETLVQPENKQALTDVLTYHVVAGTYTAHDLKKMAYRGESLTTLQGEELTPVVRGGKVMLRDASGAYIRIKMADVQASNGVVHVINKVLMV